jgi:hypothetical protein
MYQGLLQPIFFASRQGARRMRPHASFLFITQRFLFVFMSGEKTTTTTTNEESFDTDTKTLTSRRSHLPVIIKI